MIEIVVTVSDKRKADLLVEILSALDFVVDVYIRSDETVDEVYHSLGKAEVAKGFGIAFLDTTDTPEVATPIES